jgi:hypothetical protein
VIGRSRGSAQLLHVLGAVPTHAVSEVARVTDRCVRRWANGEGAPREHARSTLDVRFAITASAWTTPSSPRRASVLLDHRERFNHAPPRFGR